MSNKPSTMAMGKALESFRTTKDGYNVSDMQRVWVAARYYEGEIFVAGLKYTLFVEGLDEDALAFSNFWACKRYCDRYNTRHNYTVLYPLNLADYARRDKVRFAASQEFFDAKAKS